MRQCQELSAETVGEDSGITAKSGLPVTGLLHLLVVYIVWSTTYLAIRVAVAEGGGFPPFFLGASRLFVAGLLLLGLARLRRERLQLTQEQIFSLVLTGVLLWVGGNGLVMWAEQFANSGFTALLISSTPIWTAFIEAIYLKTKQSWTSIGALFIGFLGMLVLLMPGLTAGGATDLWASIALLGGTISWAGGSVYQNRYPQQLPALVISGYQQLIASIVFLLLAILFNEPQPQPSAQAWLAWLYLLIFGSVFAFTSYTLALRLLPMQISMTYSYVNPVLALFFGWLLLGETITCWTMAGALLVIGSVVLIFRGRFK